MSEREQLANELRWRREYIDEIQGLRVTLAEAAVPLEVLNALGHRRWRHPLLQRRWDKMVTSELRVQIAEAVLKIRSVLASAPEGGPQ